MRGEGLTSEGLGDSGEESTLFKSSKSYSPSYRSSAIRVQTSPAFRPGTSGKA